MTNAVQALLFDLGGVIVQIDFERAFAAWSSYSGVAPDVIKSRFTFDACYEAHERGEIGASEYFDSLRASLGIHLTDKQFLEGWNAILLDEMPGMATLLRQLKACIPLYLFSNSNRAHHVLWSAMFADTLANFRDVFVSSDLGLRKPDPRAFAAISAKIGAPFAEIRFFDDTEANVLSAGNLGMQAIHVNTIADVRNAVADILTPAR